MEMIASKQACFIKQTYIFKQRKAIRLPHGSLLCALAYTTYILCVRCKQASLFYKATTSLACLCTQLFIMHFFTIVKLCSTTDQFFQVCQSEKSLIDLEKRPIFDRQTCKENY
jgi:hypothetical protein